ncbi:hypothetical protein [Scandinavium sp.]|uniref:glycine-rich domain-containing protein n=1 Tax=Scandinavium sp. TaxID=2830653 RepID=UPI0028967C87|nr:hypothetical protein [Scandinavium sp.]
MNMTQGYGQAYSLDPATDPSAKRIEREKMNGLFNLITSAIGEIQVGGVGQFITADDNGGVPYSYGKGAIALLGGVVYQSLVDANTDTPPSSKWGVVSSAGNLLNVKVITSSGTYTPSPGTKTIIVECQGGGGAGGGSSATTSGNASIGAGGAEGCYGKGIFTNLSSSYSVTIGAGGVGVSGSSGGGGGTTSFGSLMSASGGYGGARMSPGAAASIIGIESTSQPAPPTVSGGNIVSSGYQGSYVIGLRLAAAYTLGAISGMGGRSFFGAGGGAASSSGAGATATAYGSGGAGSKSWSDSGTDIAYAGGNGAKGVVIVWEYS